MAYSPIAFIAPNYSDYGTYWLKAYTPGSTLPKILAIDPAGTTTFSKIQLDVNGFFTTAGGALLTPYVEGSYDAYLFQTEAEANSNNTAGATRVADNITPITTSGSFAFTITTVGLIATTGVFASTTIIETIGYTASGDGGKGRWKQNGVTGQLVNQSPAQLGLPLLNDGLGNQWAMLLTNTASFETFALLQATTSGNVGQALICRERANASYIIQPNTYTALAGDATLASGLVAALQERNEVEFFGDIYDAVSGTGVTIEGAYSQVSTTTVTMNNDTLFNFNYSLSVPDSSVVISFTPSTNGASFKSSIFNGGTTQAGGVRNRTAHMLNFGSVAVDGVSIKDSEITGFTFPILKSNSSTGIQERFMLSGNYFYGNYGVDALFNSPAASSEINNIIVNGNMFGSNLAEDIGGFSHRISMAGHVENFAVVGNVTFGSGNEFWRAEEAAKNGVVIGNAAQIGDRHGIEVTDNNAGGTYYTPSQLIISNNAIEGKATALSRGIHLTNDLIGLHALEKSAVSNNILTNFATGMETSTEGQRNKYNDNIIIDCPTGMYAKEPSLSMRNNMFMDCTTAVLARSGGLLGSIDLRSTSSSTPVFSNVITHVGNPGALTGWTYESALFYLGASNDIYIPLLEQGSVFNLDVVAYVGREESSAFTFLRATLDFDGSTLTTTVLRRSETGGVVISSSTPFRINAGNLELRIFNQDGLAKTNCKIQIQATGMHVF